MGDMVKQDAPHCHAPIHPAALVPTPVPHPALPPVARGEGQMAPLNRPAQHDREAGEPL